MIYPVAVNYHKAVISASSPECGLQATFAQGSGAVAVASTAIYIPVQISFTYTAVKMFVCNGASVSGNLDVGIYDHNANKLVSSGSTAQAGTNVVQVFDIADTTLAPGLYYLGFSMDNTSGTFLVRGGGDPEAHRAFGLFSQASTFPLPTTATWSTFTTVNTIPWVAMTSNTVV